MTDPFDACRVAYEQGQRDALDAAREAVAALVPAEFWEGIEGRPAQWWIVKAEAIAAIKGDQP